jgi:hypothetical protein
MAYDKTTFIQELGRKRIDITNAQSVKLYIPMLYKKTFTGKITDNYDPKIADVELFKNIDEFKRKYNNNPKKLPEDIFYLDKNNDYKINDLGLGRVYRDKAFAITMIEGFGNYDKFTFVKEQLNWLGLEQTFDKFKLVENIADDNEVQMLENWLEEHLGEKLFKEQQQEISDLIINELTTISKDTDYRTKMLKPATLENLLRIQLELPYAVSEPKPETKGEMRNKRYVTITKINS